MIRGIGHVLFSIIFKLENRKDPRVSLVNF